MTVILSLPAKWWGGPFIHPAVPILLGRTFVWRPKHLHNGSWAWGFVYMRRTVTRTLLDNKITRIHLDPPEYYTRAEAMMMKLAGEK